MQKPEILFPPARVQESPCGLYDKSLTGLDITEYPEKDELKYEEITAQINTVCQLYTDDLFG